MSLPSGRRVATLQKQVDHGHVFVAGNRLLAIELACSPSNFPGATLRPYLKYSAVNTL